MWHHIIETDKGPDVPHESWIIVFKNSQKNHNNFC